ncbi:P-loop containing nucleoside triphosphate hydrolase protein [Daldinia caldariorum]|uniref:P-loop containing nucleoside triphosphate hydrolase protein n=1 Tax=Daldinia caldariorum TaxID=326644 RepID=UPI0020073B00|nr:P-loop containing nucleoside triphosphate hydrolase protein [Daldinia caldariorum]KAI1472625.1 P-loop containing nucleoside triphosphate hydrolase protein [Daldinia caldariorum]
MFFHCAKWPAFLEYIGAGLKPGWKKISLISGVFALRELRKAPLTNSKSEAELFSADFIRGKGEEQIFLLHGHPGTRKTLTAESVAEYTKRPLLSITAADLGHEPVELERNLLKFFRDATSWDAIVLLDEADVYLERRSSNELKRSSINFPTRAGILPRHSRSDISLFVVILFELAKEDHEQGRPEIRYEYDAKEYVRKSEETKELEWNGREIRNTFQSAVALALYDSKTARGKVVPVEESIPEVKEAHLKEIAHMSTALKNYITSTYQGIKNSDMAYNVGIRDDNLGRPQKGA